MRDVIIITLVKRYLTLTYEFAIIAGGIGLSLSQVLIFNPRFPPFPDYLVFFFTALICALVYISLKNTIVSFEVVVYFFLLLAYDGNVASFMAVVTVLCVWVLKSIKHMRINNTELLMHLIIISQKVSGIWTTTSLYL